MNHKKYTLLIDQDDVLAEYIEGVTKNYNKKYGTHITSKQCTSWDLYKVFGEKVETVMHEPDLIRELEPTANALQIFERLYRSNLFDMYIVTAANPKCVPAKFEWIEKHLPFFPLEHVIVCKCKDKIKGDFLLDDVMHNIEAFKQAGGTPIIFNRPHNQTQGEGILRVSDWLSFERLIMEICYPDKQEEAI